MVREFVQYSPFIYFPKCVIIELIIKNALCFGQKPGFLAHPIGE